jgi:hypothetical protein
LAVSWFYVLKKISNFATRRSLEILAGAILVEGKGEILVGEGVRGTFIDL